ncbi:hypothetical protein [Janibacter corallicola]|uniref:hypothetical protein n=1 Tax=Janibacter corallicola TaxID=415212 RepID=UPI00083235F5|nr:hypothetical protein [Janibacter corallicola]
MDTRALPSSPVPHEDGQDPPQLGAVAPSLEALTVRELIARLARTEDQLNLARLQEGAQGQSVANLLIEQHRVIRELRRRH